MTAVVSVVTAVALTACGGPDAIHPTKSTVTSSSATRPTSDTANSPPPAPHPTAAAGPSYEVTTRSVGSLGTILVDGKGQTLYLFVPDHDTGRSTCYSICAVQWPPLLLPKGIEKPVATGDAKASLLGTTRRKNGTIQVTYAGWPLYWFIYDAKPGDATGQGLNNLGGLWYVLSPTGREIR